MGKGRRKRKDSEDSLTQENATMPEPKRKPPTPEPTPEPTTPPQSFAQSALSKIIFEIIEDADKWLKVSASKMASTLHSALTGKAIKALELSALNEGKLSVLEGKWEGSVEKILRAVQRTHTPVSSAPSYASVAKPPVVMARETAEKALPPRPAIRIYPIEPSTHKSSAETMEAVRQVVKADSAKFRITATAPIANCGALIRPRTKEEAVAFTKSPSLAQKGLRAVIENEKLPRVSLRYVPGEYSEQEIISLTYKNNVEGILEVTFEEFQKKFRLSHIHSLADGRKHYVFSATAEVRKLLADEGRVYLDLMSVKVVDYFNVTKCGRCHQFGHPSKYCHRKADAICGFCGDTDHPADKCTKRTNIFCASCNKYKKASGQPHRTGDLNCPARMAAISRELASINYAL